MRSKLDRAIEKLRDVDDWDETSVNVTVHTEGPRSKSPVPVRVLKLLKPWQRFVIVLVFLAIAAGTGVGSQLVLHVIGISK